MMFSDTPLTSQIKIFYRFIVKFHGSNDNCRDKGTEGELIANTIN